jgi:hypothetical protein
MSKRAKEFWFIISYPILLLTIVYVIWGQIIHNDCELNEMNLAYLNSHLILLYVMLCALIGSYFVPIKLNS